MSSSQLSLINKYRPASFEEVVGNTATIRALKEALAAPSCPHAFLLTGPSGIGKTTIARIIAGQVNAWVDEIDAATNAGIDAMKFIVESTGYTPLSGNNRMLIIDECHALTKQAWQAILKLIEEPPSFLYIALATTELAKVPETIRTRSYHIVLKPAKLNEIESYLELICEFEGWAINNTTFGAMVQASTGQPRKALSILQAGHSATSLEELAEIVSQVESDASPVLDMVHYLLKNGRNWPMIAKWLAAIDDEEEAWATATRRVSNIITGSADEGVAKNAHRLLDSLLFPRSGFDRRALFVCAITAYLWN